MKPNNMKKVGERTLMTMGKSTGVTLPPTILDLAGCKKGDKVILYSDGKTVLMIDLKPDEDR